DTRLARGGSVSRAPRSSTDSRSRRARGSRTRRISMLRPSASRNAKLSRSSVRGFGVGRRNGKDMEAGKAASGAHQDAAKGRRRKEKRRPLKAVVMSSSTRDRRQGARVGVVLIAL